MIPANGEGVAGMEELSDRLREVRLRFEQEVEPYRRSLWTYCRRLTGSVWDAEDLVQETMQRAFAGLANLWQPVHPKAYLFRVATNVWIDQRRREVRAEVQELFDDCASVDPEPHLRIEAHEAIQALVAVLTPLQRVVFLLCETLDYRDSEAAALLGTTEGAVRAALHRARLRLAGARSKPDDVAVASWGASATAPTLVQRFIEAFDRRDPDAIAALLHERATTTIVGSAIEIGRETSRRNSLEEWSQETVSQWARPGVLEGRDVLFVLAGDGDSPPRLHSIIEITADERHVLEQRIYFFCPEFLECAAAGLGVAAAQHGYQYVMPSVD